MKKIVETILSFGLVPVVAYQDAERNAISYYNIETDAGISILNRDVFGVLIKCGIGDIIAIEFTNPNGDFLNSFYAELGIENDYKWLISDGSRKFLYLRVNYLTNQLSKKGKELKLTPKRAETFEGAIIKYATQAPFSPLSLKGKDYEFVNGDIDESTPPFEIHIDILITALSEYSDITDHIVKVEQETKEEEEIVDEAAEFVETPHLPYRIYGKVPTTIKAYVDQFNLPREKDISLLGLLVVLSCCIPNIVSRHRNKKIWANLYLVITAGAASGKGVLADAVRVIEKIENFYRDQHAAAMKIFKAEYRRFKNGEIEEEPTRPPLKTIQLATDNSFIALFQQLVDNHESGLLFETEIDVFINAGKQEWGNYSTLNRKATHHEPHTIDRKSLDAPLHVKSPRLGMCMSGTPNQFFNLFKSIEDGLYSRFLVYCYQLKKINIVNPYNNEHNDYFDTTMDDISNSVFNLYQSLTDLDHEIDFAWTEAQGKSLYNHFVKMEETANPIYGKEVGSIVIRYMLDATRLGMVLTTIEAYEAGTLLSSRTLTPGDHIVDIVLGILDTCSQHSFLMMTNIRANAKAKPLEMKSMKMIKFLDALPIGKSFRTKEAIMIAAKLGISTRSVGDYIPSLCKTKHLELVSTGVYRRPN